MKTKTSFLYVAHLISMTKMQGCPQCSVRVSWSLVLKAGILRQAPSPVPSVTQEKAPWQAVACLVASARPKRQTICSCPPASANNSTVN